MVIERSWLGVVVGVVLSTTAAHADPIGLGAETVAAFGLGQAWYWRDHGSASRADWAMPATWSTIGQKLTGEGVRFDGDGFDTNALHHPLFGTTMYVIGRENGLSARGSFIYSSVASVLWETFGEWREYASINDLLTTSTSGVPVGESLVRIAHHLRATRFEALLGAGTIESGRGGALDLSADYDNAGDQAGIAVHVPFDRAGVRSRDVTARTTFGWLATEFDNHLMLERPDDPRWELFSAVKAGPTAQRAWTAGGVSLRARVDLTGDFAMLSSFAFAAWSADHPDAQVRGALRNAHPYYYAAGVTVAPRIALAAAGFELAAAVSASAFSSLDGHDRYEVLGDPHLDDTDLAGEASASYTYEAAVVHIDIRSRHRASSIGATTAAFSEQSALVSAGVRF